MNGPVLEISRRAFRRNIEAVRKRLAPSELMLVMKDDAYGLGVEWSVPEAVACGVGWFGGYDVATSLRIRALTDARVYAWATSTRAEIEQAIIARLDLGVGSPAYLDEVIAAATRIQTPVRVHLKIDTGLHRNGFRPEEWDAAVAASLRAQQRGLVAVTGVWSHLAEASDEEDDEAQRVFLDAVARLAEAGGTPEVLHLTASAAAWWRPELRGSLSRIGAFCYGVRSADGPALEGLSLVARLVAPVQAVEPEGVRVGIGAFHGLPSVVRGASVATPDGARRILEVSGSSMLLEGWTSAHEGQRVSIFGPGAAGEPDATALAEHMGTVGEEILTRLTPAVRRLVVD